MPYNGMKRHPEYKQSNEAVAYIQISINVNVITSCIWLKYKLDSIKGNYYILETTHKTILTILNAEANTFMDPKT